MKMRIKSYTDWRPSGRQTQQRLGIRIMQVDQNFRVELLELVEAGDVPVEFPNVLNLVTLLPANPNANSHSHSNTSNDIFYYHTNHLGSTAFVTDNNATITQGFLYAPFGEITTEYTPLWQNGVMPKYAFNAKELDEETGMYYYEARYMAPPTFISRDPLFEKYFWMSPYAYCANNPMKYVDPTGCDLVITGDDAEAATTQLNSTTSGKFIIYRNEDGSLGYKGRAKTRNDKFLKKVIDNHNIIVNIEAKKENSFTFSDGTTLPTECGGGYGGNIIIGNKVNAYQKVVPSMLDKMDRDVDGCSSGLYMLHEAAECYFGGKIALKTKLSSPRSGLEGSSYKKAHAKANTIAGGEYYYKKEEETLRFSNGSPMINPITGEPLRKVIFEGWMRN